MIRRALIIDGYNTATDGLMTLAKFHVETPKYKQVTQSVPGRDGPLDYSDALFGRPYFDARKLTATLESSAGTHAERQERFDALVRHCNGRRCKIVSPDYPGSYYIGRVQVSIDFNRPTYGQLELEAVCEPWRYNFAPCVASVPVLGLSSDALTSAAITYMDDVSTCEQAGYAVSMSTIAGNFTIHKGSVGSTAVWRIKLAANTDYYVAARIRDGRGTWGCATSATAKDWVRGTIRTGSDGYLYFRAQTYGSTALTISPVMVIPAAKIYTAKNGSAPAVGTVNFSAASADIGATTAAVGAGPDLTVVQVKNDLELDIPPGDVPLILYAWQAETSGQTVPVNWVRGDF